MKSYLTILFFLLSAPLLAQQKHLSKILIDSTNYRLEAIDSVQYRQYLNGSSHNSGVDTLANKNVIEFYSPFTDHFISVNKSGAENDGHDVIDLYLANSSGSEKKLFNIYLPNEDKKVKFIHWISKNSVVVKCTDKEGDLNKYTLLTFKNL